MQRLGYIIVLFLLATIGQGQALLDSSIALLVQGDYLAAKEGLSTFLIHNPSHRTASICYGRALGLGGETERALELFEHLIKRDPNDTEIQLNLAECYLWNNLPNKALKVYSSILENDKESFTANLGKGNALASNKNYSNALVFINQALNSEPKNEVALRSKLSIQNALAYSNYKKGNYKQALDILNAVLDQYPGNEEALNIFSMIETGSRTSIQSNYVIQADNGGHHNTTRSVGFHFRVNGRHKIGMRFGDNNYSMTSGDAQAKTQFMALSDQFTLNHKTQLNLNYRLASNRSGQDQFSLSTYSAGLERFWSALVYSKLQYRKENHDYNIDLLKSQIVMHHYTLSNNINFTKWLGWYSELVYTDQSDENVRKLLFTSVYFQLGQKPNLKVGHNFNYIAFAQQSLSYFSPEYFRTNEFFIQVSNQDHAQRLSYYLVMAVGQQQIENADQQITSRLDAKLHWHFKKRFILGGQYLYNNAASATALGEYSSQTFRMNLIVNLNY